MKKFLLLIAMILVSEAASARTSALQRILFELGFIEDPYIQICPEDTKIDYKATEAELWASARKAEGGYNKCKPAEYYRSLFVNFPNSYREAFRRYVETFLNAQDFVMAMNEANMYITNWKGLNDSEYIHLLLLRAVDGEIKQSWRDSNRQMEFVSFSLGASIAQTEDSPFLLNLQYRAFLDKYPQSPWKNEVLAMLNDSRQMYGKNVLSDARMFILKRDYPLAFQKYNVILKWGPAVGVFEEALYEMIQYHFELSWILTSKTLLSDFSLNQLLKRDFATVSTVEERKELSDQTRKQAHSYLEQMKTNLPNSPWTAKALKLVDAYPIL